MPEGAERQERGGAATVGMATTGGALALTEQYNKRDLEALFEKRRNMKVIA